MQFVNVGPHCVMFTKPHGSVTGQIYVDGIYVASATVFEDDNTVYVLVKEEDEMVYHLQEDREALLTQIAEELIELLQERGDL